MADEPIVQSEEKTETPVENTDVKPVEDAAEKVLSEPEAIDPLTEPYMTNPFFYEIANYFGVEQKDYENTKEKLSVIVDWAFEETKSKKPEDILLAIRKLEDAIQPAEWGERRYTNVYKYVRLATKGQAIKKAMSAYERNNK